MWQDSYVVCKVFQKEGLGPRKGAHCARPFNEEEWDDEEIGIPCAALTAPVPILPMTSDGSVPNDNLPASGCTGSASISCLSGSLPSPGTVNPTGPNDQAANDNDILPMLDIFNDDKWFEVHYIFLLVCAFFLGNAVIFVFRCVMFQCLLSVVSS